MSNLAFSPTQIKKISALHDTILVSEMEFDERISSGGIVLLNDDMKSSGIRPRVCQVYAIGPYQTDVTVGQWLLVEHGRWSRGIDIEIDGQKKTIRKVDPNSILLVSDEFIDDATISDKVVA